MKVFVCDRCGFEENQGRIFCKSYDNNDDCECDCSSCDCECNYYNFHDFSKKIDICSKCHDEWVSIEYALEAKRDKKEKKAEVELNKELAKFRRDFIKKKKLLKNHK